jgi:dipeptidyl aminopeptidase/acylaminoacyl peptidase
MSQEEKPVVIYSKGQKIFGNLCLPQDKAPCVVMSHGLESSKDSDKWRLLSSRFCDAGFASLRFSYRGCGVGEVKSEGNFEDTTLTDRIQDYTAAIDFLYKTRVDTNRLGVIGSSLGGMVVLAARDERIKVVTTLATPSNILFPDAEAWARAKESGYFELGSGSKLRRRFFNDAHHYKVCEDIGKMHCPVLIIHGTNDEVVPVKDAYNLYGCAHNPKRLEIIEGANHSFDNLEHRGIIVNLSLEWFEKYL